MRIDMTIILDKNFQEYENCVHMGTGMMEQTYLRLTTEQARALWVALAKNLRDVKKEEKC